MLTKIANIGTVKELRYENKSLILVVNLKGITEDISLTCKNIKPASDNSYVELSGFSSNIEGIDAALKMLPPINLPIQEGDARLNVGAVRKILGL
ncbi:MAG: hypothetical protein IJT59_05420 [Desulfovibrionaceae bacterium]|nr:hypothetical protein [Desulfovibrionaceae bacterium]